MGSFIERSVYVSRHNDAGIILKNFFLRRFLRLLIDVLDPNKKGSTDKVTKLATVFPDDIPDSDALFANREVLYFTIVVKKKQREQNRLP